MQHDARSSDGDRTETHESGLMRTAPPSVIPWEEETDQRFRALIEQLQEVVIVRRGERIAYVNPSAVATLGYDQASDLVGRPFDEIVDREDLSAQPGNATRPSTLRLVRRDGETRVVEVVSLGLDFDDGPSLVFVARDVTELRELQARRALNERLAAFNTPVTGVAHELNNPMTSAFAGVDVALRRLRIRAASGPQDDDDAIALEALERALTGLNRMRDLVRNLVTFAHGDPETRSIVDVRSVLESAIALASHQIRHRGRIDKELHEVPPVEANAARLGQVFLNVLVNAAEAIPEGQADLHCVRVVTRATDDGTVAIEVADTGVGISAEELPRIFDPFFSTKGPSAGTGLGLSIAHGIVRDLGGRISVQSTVGEGTVVRLELPCARAWKRAPTPSSVGSSAVEPCRVLVIDDDRLVGDAIAVMLSHEADISAVTSAEEALRQLANGARFDVILCDLMMPVMTGMDFYADLVRAAPDAMSSVVFMTGAESSPRARAFVGGLAGRCLQKPVDVKELRELVRNRTRAHAHG